MAFDNERKKFSREHLWYCEIEIDSTVYRFCENRSPIPAGLNVEAASMKSQSFRPATIDLEGGIGVRASASVSFDEHQDYKTFGSITNPVRFWVNWRARHPGYQGARFSLFSGYIVNGNFDANNFQRRDYVIETFSHSEKGASIGAKDALKMTSGDRAKAPAKSTGLLSADINSSATAITLTPSGVGNSEYPASGYGRMGDEVVSFTRTGDSLSLVRGQYNTSTDDHSINDVFQLCLYYNETVTDIIYDLYTNYAGVPTSQINQTQWDDEASLYLSGLYEALITEPTGVSDLVKELAESAPHYQYWDERDNFIKFIAIKPPPDTANVLTAENNLLRGSTSISDMPDMRISTVIVRFGQFDPTKELDEISNYRQAHLRLNPSAVTRYNGIEKFKEINSRWINNDNRAAGVRLAARFGRRFEDTPRKIAFSLDAKDADVWAGSPAFINSDLIVESSSPYARYDMPVQVISAGENKAYQYTAIEHTYGPERPEDLGADNPNDKLIVLSGNLDQLKDDNGNIRTLRDFYDGLEPTVIDAYNITFLFDGSCVAGSSTTDQAIDTGSWPELTTKNITLDVRGYILGKGGDGATVGSSPTAGGLAILLNADIDLTNTGVIGGGGGGGHYDEGDGSGVAQAAGGGGAGYFNGPAGGSTIATGNGARKTDAQDGTNTVGGAGGEALNDAIPEPSVALGGDGGDLGQAGGNASGGTGGAAGAAIDLNGYTITYINTGTILGTVS